MSKSFFCALGFLTRLPVPGMNVLPSDREQGNSLLFYPVVGLIIGLILSGIATLLTAAEPLFTAAILLTVWVVITGGLHIDGLADVADAWVGGQGDRERTLAIMKDPTCGPIAVASIVLLLILKLAALQSLVATESWVVLLLIPVLGRAALVAGFLYMPYIRSGGLGGVMAENLPRPAAKRVLLIVLLCCFLLWGWAAAWLVIGSGLVFMTIKTAMMKRINGLTGDVAGTLCELIEVTALVVAVLAL